MEIYSEYYNGERKATVTLIKRHWDSKFNVWEVAMYVGTTCIRRASMTNEVAAENLAEDFVNGGDSAPTLLNENISNG